MKPHYYFICFLILVYFNVSGQKSYELIQPDNTSKTYIARDYIRLLPGYSFNSAGGKTLFAGINEHLLEPAAYQSLSQIPDPDRNLNTSYAVGTTAGEASVSPTGAAIYQIPIEITPGTAGIQPNVSVVYNSQSGNGLLGYGWNLNAVSAIVRAGKTIYHDGVVSAPLLNSSDNLLLDGQRLINVSSPNLSYGAKYRTELESFLDITYTNPGASYMSFTVKNKEGWTLLYGSSDDSNIKFKNETTTYCWLLKKVMDANGNYMTYTYDNNAETGEFRLKQIDYTANDVATLQSYNKIEFFYETRSDKSNAYIAGKSLEQTIVLKKIKCSAYNSTIREYRFNYYHDGFYSKLTEIEEYGQYGMRYNSTVIGWGDNLMAESPPVQKITLSPNIGANDFVRYADFNGDGCTDFISYPSKSTYSTSDKAVLYLFSPEMNCTKQCELSLISGFQGFYFGDFNGDGYLDIARVHSSGSTYKFQIYLYNGTSFSYKSEFTSSGADAFIGDFNGDGKAKILTKTNPKLYNENGSEIASCSFDLSNNVVIPGRSSRRTAGKGNFILDFNGNGKMDIALKSNSSIEIYELNGNSFSLIASTSIGTVDLDKLRFGDFNGDGKTDILKLNPDNQAGGTIFFSTGSSFKEQPVLNVENFSVNSIISDYNGDGKADILDYKQMSSRGKPNPVNIRIGIFNESTSSFDMINYEFQDNLISIGTNYDFVNFNDFDGDGCPEFSYDGYYDVNCIKQLSQYKNHRVKDITNGINHKVQFDYLPITDNSIYKETIQTYAFPVSKIRIPLYCVKSVKNILGNITSIDNFTYKNARIHKQGKGFLGFEEMSSTNTTQNRKITTQYAYNSTYYNVYPVKQTITTISGDSIARTTFKNNYFVSSGTKVIFPYISYQETIDHLTGLAKKTEYTYSSVNQGNPDKITETQGSLITETVNTWEAKNSSFKNRITKQIITKKGLGKQFTETKSFDYDSYARLIKRVDFSGHTKAVTTQYSNYDNFGNPKTVSTTAANCPAVTTNSAYDATGRFIVSHTDELGNVSSFRYDERTGLLLEKRDIAGLTTTYQYDGFQQLLRENAPNNILTYNQLWDISNNNLFRIDVISQISGTQSTWYNVLGQETKKQARGFSGLVVTEKEYNSKGQLYKEYLPGYGSKSSQYVEYAYDSCGRIQSETNIGRITSYDYKRLTTTTTLPDGTTRSSTLNLSGLIESSKDAANNQVTYTYNSLGKPVTTSSNGITTHINYDDRGFQTALKDANLLDSIKYVYDAYGQLITQTNARKQTTSMQYDAAGRMIQKSCPERILTYQYVKSGNGIGQLQTIKNGNQVIQSCSYTNRGQTASITENIDNIDYTTSYIYDLYGQMLEQKSPSGMRTSYQYRNGLLVSMRNGDSNALLWQADAVNALGQITESSLGNSLKRISGYDTYHLPNQILLKNGTSVIDLVNYSFDPVTGNLTERNDISNNRKEVFGYDILNRLESIRLNNGSANMMSYYPNGNLKTKFDVGTYQYENSNHAVSKITDNASAYNPPAFDITNTSYNRVSSLTQQGPVVKKINFQYDAGNQRQKSSYYENNVLKKTMYYAGNYEKEIIAGGTTKEYDYIYTPEGLTAIAIKTNGTRSLYYAQTDHLGSIRVVITESKAIQTRYYYDAWGKQTLAYGTSITNRGYIGQEHLNEFGLINLNARLYDPVLGRFLGMDPYVQDAGFTQSHNRYSYGMNNPLCYVDENGEFWHIIIGAVVGGIINWATHGCKFTWEGLSYFGVGAISGAVTAWTGQAWIGGAIMGGGNTFVSQGFAGGDGNSWNWNNIDLFQIGMDATMGGLTAYLGGQLAGKISPVVSQYTSKLGGPVIQDMLTESITSGATGFTLGAGMTALNGGDFKESMQAGWNSAKVGLAVGAASGAASGYQRAIKEKVNPWTGKDKQIYEIGEGVRRTKAAQELGQKTIKAEDHTGKTFDVPIENLRSPMKSEIDVSNPDLKLRYQNIYDATKAGEITTPIYVQPGDRGIKIRNIRFKY